ncbi:hypothetical protein OWR29_40595 [Actinoplanes sp. Pm04-4]|uniref:Uncharacterized protein n=1 Tax=Paractinoplanes pyxinae TaxID=2997416 RepID=A0ABT4BCW6_9ACTN|nr:hypothetical protein [Actinoplanes pyxinae]MCY1144332.1 hypothetical protein [Actinoplanes pyxinae]
MFERFRRGGAQQPDGNYVQLRRMILGTDPAEAGIAPAPDLPRVWGQR